MRRRRKSALIAWLRSCRGIGQGEMFHVEHSELGAARREPDRDVPHPGGYNPTGRRPPRLAKQYGTWVWQRQGVVPGIAPSTLCCRTSKCSTWNIRVSHLLPPDPRVRDVPHPCGCNPVLGPALACSLGHQSQPATGCSGRGGKTAMTPRGTGRDDVPRGTFWRRQCCQSAMTMSLQAEAASEPTTPRKAKRGGPHANISSPCVPLRSHPIPSCRRAKLPPAALHRRNVPRGTFGDSSQRSPNIYRIIDPASSRRLRESRPLHSPIAPVCQIQSPAAPLRHQASHWAKPPRQSLQHSPRPATSASRKTRPTRQLPPRINCTSRPPIASSSGRWRSGPRKSSPCGNAACTS